MKSGFFDDSKSKSPTSTVYIAPEAVKGSELTQATDVYSFGKHQFITFAVLPAYLSC